MFHPSAILGRQRDKSRLDGVVSPMHRNNLQPVCISFKIYLGRIKPDSKRSISNGATLVSCREFPRVHSHMSWFLKGLYQPELCIDDNFLRESGAPRYYHELT